jgi:hypothetical protein
MPITAPVERRYCARHRFDLPVYIRYRKRRFLGARGRDLSDRGMFLRVRALTLPVGTPVELEFRALGRGWLVPAVVIHGDNAGIGVMFRDTQAELFKGLVQEETQSVPPVVDASASIAQAQPS